MIFRDINLTYLIAIFNLLIMEAGFTQPPITFHNQLSVDNYLSDREVRRLDRDSDGFFWLLETSIIQKYDGRYVTENIAHPVVNPKYFSCLSNNLLILVSQEAEAFLVNKDDKTLHSINTDLSSCPECEIIDINLINENLFLFFRSQGKVVVFKSSVHENYEEWEQVDEFPFSKMAQIRNIFKLQDQYLITIKGDRVFKLDNHSELELALPPGFRATTEALVSNFINESDLFFSLPQRKGTFRFKDNHFTIVDNEEKLAFAKEDNKGKIILALSESFKHSEQMYILDGDSLEVWEAITDINQTYIDAYVEDLEEQILLGSHSGLFFVKMRTKGILPSHQSSTLTNSFGYVIMSLAELPSGEIVYVKENKGIFKYNGSEGPEQLPLSNRLVNNLNCQYDKVDGKLWISGYSNQRTGLLFSYDLETGDLDKHTFEKPVMYFKRLDKDLFILSTSVNLRSTILMYNTKTKTILDTLLSIDNERSRRFEFHGDTELLIGTSKRVIAYDLAQKTTRTILPETIVQSVVPTSKGYAICTLGKGVVFLNDSLEVIVQVTESEGLSNNNIYNLLESDNGRYWVGTGNGLNVLDSDFKFIRSFDTHDGLSSYEFNTNAVLKRSNGNLLFGTINGVTEINPDLAMVAPESTVLSVPSISYQINGERITQAIQGPDINLDVDAENITLRIVLNAFYKFDRVDKPFGIQIYSDPEDLIYSRKENDIIIPEIIRSPTKLTILPSNLMDPKEIIQLNIYSKKDYTWLFWGVGLLAFISFLSYLIIRKVISFNKERYNEKRENEVKMAELELQALRSQMNPHFIFNSLGAILLYLQTNEKKKAEKYLTKFAKLMRMFLESSKAKFISFGQEQELLEVYLQLEKLRFEDKFSYTFDIDQRIDVYNLTIPSMLLQPFVENSINHGLYHKKGNKGKLLIKAVPSGDNVTIYIRDNGVGREKAQKIRESSLKKHRSRATEIIQERISILKKEKNIDIDITYNDLYDSTGTSNGTEVLITIPKMLRIHD